MGFEQMERTKIYTLRAHVRRFILALHPTIYLDLSTQN
jgi:hypothetical protein